MRRLRLVAWHEFVKYVTRRGFIISVLMMPMWIVLGAVVPGLLKNYESPAHYVVVDRNGAYAAPLHAALLAHREREVAEAKEQAAHVKANAQNLQNAATARFKPPREMLIEEPAPAGLAGLSGDAFRVRVTRLLGHGVDAVVVIPQNFGADNVPAEFWQSGPPKPDLFDFVRGALTETVRRQRLAAVAPAASLDVLDIFATVKTIDPSNAHATASQALARKIEKITPFAFAFFLMLTIFMNSASLMSAVIEEKSSKIVEVMLSAVSPYEFMAGKLIGAAGASLLTLAIWGGGAGFAAWNYLDGGPAVVSAVAASLTHGWVMPMLLLSFVCGLMIYSSIFLGIGSLAASVQDAQALVGPTMILVTVPFFVMPALITDPNGAVASTLTWIPIYTPFMMMFRLPWNPPQAQVLGALVLMVVTAAFFVWQMGRIFAANVLTADKPPRFGAMIGAIFGRRMA